MLPFASVLHRAGYALLLFDARNHGKSDPDDFSSMPKFSEDLGHAIDWLDAQPGIAPGEDRRHGPFRRRRDAYEQKKRDLEP